MDRLSTPASNVNSSLVGGHSARNPCRVRQARYWLLTIPEEDFTPYSPLPHEVEYLAGQLEVGANTGYRHWQVIVYFRKKATLRAVKAYYPTCHAEPTRSNAARSYVWKDDTAVSDTRFELGTLPMQRNSKHDWERIFDDAVAGNWDSIPRDVYIRSFTNLNKIHVQKLRPTPGEKRVYVYWGRTGSGKSRRAWDEASFDAYPKDPCTKWWCGYQGHKSVVIDEFRGQIGISHLLRWFDRYPVILESKGSSCVSRMESIWITSNLSPDDWYPGLDDESLAALKRRFTEIVHFE